MQLEESRQSITVRAGDQLEGLTLEHRRRIVVRHPRGSVYNKFDTDQAHSPLLRLVDQRLRTGGIEFAIADQGPIHEVNTHCAVIRATDATEKWLVSRRLGGID